MNINSERSNSGIHTFSELQRKSRYGRFSPRLTLWSMTSNLMYGRLQYLRFEILENFQIYRKWWMIGCFAGVRVWQIRAEKESWYSMLQTNSWDTHSTHGWPTLADDLSPCQNGIQGIELGLGDRSLLDWKYDLRFQTGQNREETNASCFKSPPSWPPESRLKLNSISSSFKRKPISTYFNRFILYRRRSRLSVHSSIVGSDSYTERERERARDRDQLRTNEQGARCRLPSSWSSPVIESVLWIFSVTNCAETAAGRPTICKFLIPDSLLLDRQLRRAALRQTDLPKAPSGPSVSSVRLDCVSPQVQIPAILFSPARIRHTNSRTRQTLCRSQDCDAWMSVFTRLQCIFRQFYSNSTYT